MPISPRPSKTGSRRLSRPNRRCSPTTARKRGLAEKAVEYWLAAGRQAWARSAAAEAVALLRRGLALVPALPDTDRRRETELDLQIALGQALITSRSWGVPEVAEAYSRARELASTLNRPRALLSILWGQFLDDLARADLQRGQRFATEIRELGDATGDVLDASRGLPCRRLTSASPWGNSPQVGRTWRRPSRFMIRRNDLPTPSWCRTINSS